MTPFYDPLLAKIIATGEDRAAALAQLRAALAGHGSPASRRIWIICDSSSPIRCSRRGGMTTRALDGFDYRAAHASRCCRRARRPPSRTIPGGVGFWNVGRAAVGPDGQPVVPARQPRARQSRRTRRRSR